MSENPLLDIPSDYWQLRELYMETAIERDWYKSAYQALKEKAKDDQIGQHRTSRSSSYSGTEQTRGR